LGQRTKNEVFVAIVWEAKRELSFFRFQRLFCKIQQRKTKEALITHQKCIILLKNKKVNECCWVKFLGRVSFPVVL